MRAHGRRNWSYLVGYLLVALPLLVMLLLIFYPAILAVIDTLFLHDDKTAG